MTKVDDTYQNEKVYFPQGADKLAIDSDGSFDFFSEEILTGAHMRALALSNSFTDYATSGSVFASNNATLSYYGVHRFSGATGLSLTSFVMPPALRGAVIKLQGSGLVGDANVSVYISVGTMKNYISNGTLISSFEISAAAPETVIVCGTDGEWAVVAGNIAEHTLT